MGGIHKASRCRRWGCGKRTQGTLPLSMAPAVGLHVPYGHAPIRRACPTLAVSAAQSHAFVRRTVAPVQARHARRACTCPRAGSRCQHARTRTRPRRPALLALHGPQKSQVQWTQGPDLSTRFKGVRPRVSWSGPVCALYRYLFRGPAGGSGNPLRSIGPPGPPGAPWGARGP